jgi:hypothetical protein
MLRVQAGVNVPAWIFPPNMLFTEAIVSAICTTLEETCSPVGAWNAIQSMAVMDPAPVRVSKTPVEVRDLTVSMLSCELGTVPEYCCVTTTPVGAAAGAHAHAHDEREIIHTQWEDGPDEKAPDGNEMVNSDAAQEAMSVPQTARPYAKGVWD